VGSRAGAATAGTTATTQVGTAGGLYGGGAGACDSGQNLAGGAGGQGACRLIWGIARIYPSASYATGSLSHG
jgi:hypothetical protein